MTDTKFQDLAELDAKIPPNFMMNYQGKPYILKSGLEYKASQVFGVGKYGIDMEIVERTDDRITVKATLTTPAGMKFVNFGECNKLNTPPAMAKYALHLAVTRAECRVLRSATACGYVAYEEVSTSGDTEEVKAIPASPKDGEAPTEQQLVTLASLAKSRSLLGYKIPTTQRDAKQMIAELLEKK